MYQIKKEATIEIKEKKSKFITRALVVRREEEVADILTRIKQEEKQAVHNCFAFRILSDNGSVVEKKSDDGEPGGTAGAPMLAVLTGEDVINTLAVTSRYFGGIKLGTGGLVNVYKRGVQKVLKATGKELFVTKSVWKISISINKADMLTRLLDKINISILDKKFGEQVYFILEVPEDKEDEVKDASMAVHGEIIKLEQK